MVPEQIAFQSSCLKDVARRPNDDWKQMKERNVGGALGFPLNPAS